ncbi:ABC transporter permease [Neorhizobium galegae]|uniref:ABC transporter permease n=1 Tax=Neorhizobium galegae TaxID=399 RepID=UPI0006220B17|nr:ABC transporter permease [Neorhizobium galegae]CDZ28072.1 Putative binding-protein-dependent transport permease [Neorhizobium galegae bv. officinalis]KAA9386895.1 ABC transporter permease [Neorhizobium galegae]KAB1116035.1 ABC transporter permease [Neorhizobium galegae]MCM2498036.1 ABC transporter permease [Neorhizobium galegae]MCQ1774080.1 ABC transporter permease [Neorhizobium galegae]
MTDTNMTVMTQTAAAPAAKATLPPPVRFRFWAWLWGDKRALISLAYLSVLVLAAIFAPLIVPYAPNKQNLMDLLAPPSGAHWLGTDDLGRDTLSRLIYGSYNALYAASLAVGIGVAIGVPLGVFIGFVGGWVDQVGSRIIDGVLAFPPLVLAVAVTGALGIGLTNAMIAVGFAFAPVLARTMRAQTLVVKNALYVEAAVGFGASRLHLILRHILPNAIQPVIVEVTLMLAVALLAEAGLSFLSLGVQPPESSWGGMLARAYHYVEVAPEQMYAPGFAILFTALAFNTLGESIRVLLDPTIKRR